MDIVGLVRFLAIIDHKTFAAAARELQITPQALSISVAKLETDLGVSLFDRTRGGTTQPTSFALALTSHARAIVAAQKHAIDEIHAIRDGRSGWVRLGVGESMTGAMAAKAVAQLKSEDRGVNIVLVEDYTTGLLQSLEHGDIDLVAGAPNQDYAPKPFLEQVLLYKTRDRVAVRKEHPLVRKRRIRLEDMRPYTWLLPYARSDSYRAVVTAYLEAGLRPPDNYIFSDTYTLGSYLLSQEDYIHLVSPDLMWMNDMQPIFTYLDVPEPTIERHACLMYRNDLPLSAAALRLKDLLIESTAHLNRR